MEEITRSRDSLQQDLMAVISHGTLDAAVELLACVPTYTLLAALRCRVDVQDAMDGDELSGVLDAFPSVPMFSSLSARGGHPGAVAEAVLLCAKKSADYNQGMGHLDIHNVDRSSYFPFGAISYAQMLHTKSERFCSLVKKQLNGEAPNFESLRDTALDIINYAGFFAGDPKAQG